MKKSITLISFLGKLLCLWVMINQNSFAQSVDYLNKAEQHIGRGNKDSASYFLQRSFDSYTIKDEGDLRLAYTRYCMAFGEPIQTFNTELVFDQNVQLTQFKNSIDQSIHQQLLQTVAWATQHNDELVLADAYLLLTQHFQNHLQFNQSIKWNYKAIALFGKHQQTLKQALAKNLLANSFMLTGEIEEGIQTMKASAQLYLEQEDSNSHARGYYLLAKRATYISGNEFSDSAEYFFNEALSQIIELNNESDQLLLYGIYTNKGVNLSRNNQQEKSLECFKQALTYSSFSNKRYNYSLSFNIGAIYSQLGQIDSATKYVEITIKHLEEAKNLSNATEIYKGISMFYEEILDHEQALKYHKRRSILLDSLYHNMHQDSLLAYQLQFEYEKKEAVLEAEKKAEAAQFNLKVKHKEHQVKILLLGSFFILFSVVIGFILWTRLKKKIKDEKQKEDYLKLVVSAQRAERKKIAHLLHDSCGASLAAVKLSLNSLLNKPLSKELQEKKSIRVFSIIDSVAKDIRDLSHDLLPYEAGKLSIEMSIQTLFDNLLTTAGIQFSLHSNLNGYKLPEQYEYGIYQIVTELTNNVLKHSNASEVEVRLLKKDNQLTLTYLDNGTGKPKDITEGIGQKLIKTQLIALNGKMEYSLVRRRLCCEVVFLL